MNLNYKLSKSDDTHPWLILIHGLFGNADNLAGIKRHFKSSYNIVSFDLPDHGESPWTDGFNVKEAAEDFTCADVIDHSCTRHQT